MGAARAEQGPAPPGPGLQAGPTFQKKAWAGDVLKGGGHLIGRVRKTSSRWRPSWAAPGTRGAGGPEGRLQDPRAPTARPPASGFRAQLLISVTRYLCNLHFSVHRVIFTSSLSNRDRFSP